jgi:hypothetical protein
MNINDVLDGLKALGSEQTWIVASAMLIASTISMAILQIVKEISPLRRYVQRLWVDAWLKNGMQGTVANHQASDAQAADAEEVWAKLKRDVEELTTGGNKNALYELPPDDMISQFNAASVIVLDERHEDFLRVLARGAQPADIETVLGGQPGTGLTTPYFDARNRCARRIQRNLEGLRISMSYRWRRAMQGTALLLTVLLVEIALCLRGPMDRYTLLWGAILGLVGGYLAPIMRDLVAALQRLREPI